VRPFEALEIDRGLVAPESQVVFVPLPSHCIRQRAGMRLHEAERAPRPQQAMHLVDGRIQVRLQVMQAADHDDRIERVAG
jgi:hypothetical protein